nr:helix-turn-helix transcriptional regulator [uncultured Clostridium sp.]
MPFQNVTNVILNEEAQELKEICTENPEVMKSVSEFDKEFELRLKLIEARKKAGLTQKEVEERSGLAQQAISRIETDNNISPSIKSLIKYVDAIGYELTLSPKRNQ